MDNGSTTIANPDFPLLDEPLLVRLENPARAYDNRLIFTYVTYENIWGSKFTGYYFCQDCLQTIFIQLFLQESSFLQLFKLQESSKILDENRSSWDLDWFLLLLVTRLPICLPRFTRTS
jgi:hypothetical protein